MTAEAQAETQTEAMNLTTLMLALCSGKPLIAACTAHAASMTASVREHFTREQFEEFVYSEFPGWCMDAFDRGAKPEGGDQS